MSARLKMSFYHFFQSLSCITGKLAHVRARKESPRAHRHSGRDRRRRRQRRLQTRRRRHRSCRRPQVEVNSVFCGLPRCRLRLLLLLLLPAAALSVVVMVSPAAATAAAAAAGSFTGDQILTEKPKFGFCYLELRRFLVYLQKRKKTFYNFKFKLCPDWEVH